MWRDKASMSASSSPRRHARLETLLKRWTAAGGAASREQPLSSASFLRYQSAVVSGVDPAGGQGPLPYFAYLVLTPESLLAVRWPEADGAQLLVSLAGVSEIEAVSHVPAIFLISPDWQHAQKIRISYVTTTTTTGDDRLTAEEGGADVSRGAIDLYLLQDAAQFVHSLRAKWIFCLIRQSLDGERRLRTDGARTAQSNQPSSCPTDVYTAAADAARHYEWVTRHFRSSAVHHDEESRVCSRHIASCSRRDANFRRLFWSATEGWRWLCGRAETAVRRLIATTVVAREEAYRQPLMHCLRDLTAVLECADSAAAWPIVESSLAQLVAMWSDVIARKSDQSTNNDDELTDAFVDLMFSVTWLPPHGSATCRRTPVAGVTRALAHSYKRNSPCRAMVMRSLSLIKSLANGQLPPSPPQTVSLFKCLSLLRRTLESSDHRLTVLAISNDFSEEFRYYCTLETSTALLLPSPCPPLQERTIQLMKRVKSIVLDSRMSILQFQ